MAVMGAMVEMAVTAAATIEIGGDLWMRWHLVNAYAIAEVRAP